MRTKITNQLKGELTMEITFERILETATKHKIKGNEFLSMCRSNDFNPFESELIMKVVITTIIMGFVMDSICTPNKRKMRKSNDG